MVELKAVNISINKYILKRTSCSLVYGIVSRRESHSWQKQECM